MTTQRCIKRPLSVWTTCKCPKCRVLHRRLCKLRDAGALPPRPDPELAWARIDEWTQAGYSPSWIASACGLNPRGIETALSERNGGHVRRLGARVTAMILAADIDAGTMGHGPALVARRQLQALACHGYDTSRLQAVCGISFVTLASIRRGNTALIRATHHHQVAAMYDQLCETFGDSAQAKARALRLGWAPPYLWDDITDPNETPDTMPAEPVVDEVLVQRALAGQPVRLSEAERAAALPVLAARGLSDAQIADRLQCHERTIFRARGALGIPSAWTAA